MELANKINPLHQSKEPDTKPIETNKNNQTEEACVSCFFCYLLCLPVIGALSN